MNTRLFGRVAGKLKVLLCVLLSFTLALSGMACGGGGGETETEFDAAFKSGVKTQVRISDQVDLEDYIVKVDGATFEITVSYKDDNNLDKSEKFGEGNMIFTPKATGAHTIVYDVTKGKTTKTANMTFTVIGDPPSITKQDTPVVIKTSEDPYNLETLLGMANVITSPVSASVTVDEIAYRTVQAGFTDVYGEWTDSGYDGEDATFIFGEAGEYKLSITADNAGQTAEDTVSVIALDDSSAGNAAAEGVFVAGNNAIFGGDDGNVVTLPANPALAQLSYAVVEREIGEKLQLIFKGKNIPNVTLLAEGADADVPYALQTGEGISLTFGGTVHTAYGWYVAGGNGKNFQRGGGGTTGAAHKDDTLPLDGFDVSMLDDDTYYILTFNVTRLNDTTLDSGGIHYVGQANMDININPLTGYGTDDWEIDYDTDVFNKTGSYGWGTIWIPEGYPDNTKAVIYGSKTQMVTVQVYEDVDTRPMYKTTAAKDGTINMEGGNQWLDAAGSTRARSDYAYLGAGEFMPGDTMTVYFTGKNIPNVALYCDTDEGQPIGGGTGFFFGPNYYIRDAFVMRGPWRLDPGTTVTDDEFKAVYDKVKAMGVGIIDYSGVYNKAHEMRNFSIWESAATFGIRYKALEDEKEYKWEITTAIANKDAEGESLGFTMRLYEKSGDGWSEKAAQTLNVKNIIRAADEEFSWDVPRYAVFYGPIVTLGDGSHGPISFKYEITKAV